MVYEIATRNFGLYHRDRSQTIFYQEDGTLIFNIVFKTEDCLLENSVFDWQKYKQERMFARVNITEQKKNLKVGASLEDAGVPEK